MKKGLEHKNFLSPPMQDYYPFPSPILRMVYKRSYWILACSMLILSPSKLLLKYFHVVNKTYH